MNGATQTSAQGYEPEVFDSIIDTYPGGLNIDVTGYTNPNGVIPKGTVVSLPDAVTGLSKVGAAAIAAGTFLGLVRSTVAIDNNPLVGVVIAGTAKKLTLPTDEQTAVAKLIEGLPRITFK